MAGPPCQTRTATDTQEPLTHMPCGSHAEAMDEHHNKQDQNSMGKAWDLR